MRLLAVLLLVALPPWPTALAAIVNGAAAIDVLGQDDGNLTAPVPIFTKVSPHNGPNRLGYADPWKAVVDSGRHRLFVADSANRRVLVYDLNPDGSLPDRLPDHVLGQPNFYSRQSVLSQSGLSNPTGLAYDPVHDRLYVVDTDSHRVLVYDTAVLSNGMNAAFVLGQASFTAGAAATTQARMNLPRSVALDVAGQRLFVADRDNARVLVFDTTALANGMNAVHVLGQSDFTSAIQATTQAGMSRPRGVAFNATTQRLFVGDAARVLVFDVATIANGMNASNVIGQANFTASVAATTQAGMGLAYDVAADAVNNRLFVVDQANHRVLVYNTAAISDGMNAANVIGQTSFTGGNANTAPARLNSPYAVSYDAAGNRLLIGDALNRRVVFHSAAAIANGQAAIDVLGQLDDDLVNPGPVYTKGGVNNSVSRFGYSSPTDVALDSVNHRLFVADGGNNRVLVYLLAGDDTIADRRADYVLGQVDFRTGTAGSTAARMNAPSGLAYSRATGRLFVSDRGNNRVLVFDTQTLANGMSATHVLGQPGFSTVAAATTQSGLAAPRGLALDDDGGRLFVADRSNHRVVVYDVASLASGENAIHVLGQAGFTTNASNVSATEMNGPRSVAYDRVRDRLFVADSNNNRVLVFDAATLASGMAASNVLGQTTFTNAGSSTSQGGMANPQGLAYDASYQRLFVAANNNRVTVYPTAAIVNGMNASHVLGQALFTTNAVTTTAAGMDSPTGLAYDATNHRLHVTDSAHHRFTVFDVFPAVTHTISGTITFGAAPLAGATVTLAGSQSGSATTDASGNYAFAGLGQGGTYTVTPGKAGHTFAPSSRSYASLAVSQSADFTVATLAPAFTSAAPAGGQVGQAYSHTFSAAGFPAPAFALTAGALPSGLTIAAASGVLSGTPTVAGNFSGTITASNGAAPDATQAFSIAIARGSQTIDFAALGHRTYGDGPFAMSASASSALPVSFASLASSVCTLSGSVVTLMAAGTCTIRASQSGDANYAAAADVDRSFNVAAAGQTITFAALAGRTYGDAPFAVNATASSGLAVTFASLASSVCTVSGGVVSLVATGTCVIRASQAGNASYGAANDVDRSFAVAAAAQAIGFAPLADRQHGDPPFGVSATASSGLPVTFASLSPSVCTLGGSTVTVLSIGTCTIAADQPGNGNYAAAARVVQSFTVAATVPGTPTLTGIVAGSGRATLSFAAPASDGGAAIGGYTATCMPGSHSGSGATSPLVVTGLANGTAYTCTLTASNSAGSSAASNSLPVTPQSGAITSFVASAPGGSGLVSLSFTGGGEACTFTSVAAIAAQGDAQSPPALPSAVGFADGLVKFTTSSCEVGATLAFTLTVPSAPGDRARYWTYGRRSGDAAPQWYVLPASVGGGTIVFAVTDGGVGDDDLAADGGITGLGGAGLVAVVPPTCGPVPAPLTRSRACGPGLSGVIDEQAIYACTSGHWILERWRTLRESCTPESSPPPSLVRVIEFHHAALDHYFITASAEEIAVLDGGAFGGWTRTGLEFNAFAPGTLAQGGAAPVCRFYGSAAAGINSHFYSAAQRECAEVKSRFAHAWLLESENVFEIQLPDPLTGACPAGTRAVYRSWNARVDSNHRYTTDARVHAAMLARGDIGEGYGERHVAMCAP